MEIIRIAMLAISLLYAVVMIAVGIPLMRRRIAPNDFVGIRTPETRSSPELWYQVNEYAGRLFVQIGEVCGAVALVLFPHKFIPDFVYFGLCSLLLIATGIIGTLRPLAYLREIQSREGIEHPPLPKYIPFFLPALIYTAVVALVMVALSAYAWGKIPAGRVVPIHWGAHGPDNFADKLGALVLWPAEMFFSMLVITMLLTWPAIKDQLLVRYRSIFLFLWVFMISAVLLGHVIIIINALR